MNTFEAAWNHHTPPIFYFFKLIFQFADFVNIYEGFFILYSALLISINILLYKLIYKLTDSNFVSLLFLYCLSLTYHIQLLERQYCLTTEQLELCSKFVLYSFKIIDNLDQRNVVIWSLITSLFVCFLRTVQSHYL